MSIVWYFVALVVLIALSAFFSASEMSYSSANRLRLENAAEDGNRRARAAVGILDHYDSALSAILIGNNLVNIASSSLGSVIVILLAGEQWTWVSTVVLTLLVIIFGETMPKDRRQAKRQRHRPAQCLCHPRAVDRALSRDLARGRSRAPDHAPAARRHR